METIISSVISASAAIMVCVITQIVAAKKTNCLLEYRLNELTKKVEKHNNLVERTYKLEELTSLQEEKIKVANQRLSNLERRKE